LATMFGRHHRDDPSLSAKAHAEILEVDATRVAVTITPSPVVANTEQMWKLKLRVMPDGADPFDVDVEQLLPQLEPPRVGQVVPVVFDPDDHSKVAFDRDQTAQASAVAEMIESRLDPQQAATLRQVTGGSVQDLISEAMADPQGFAARMKEKAEAAHASAIAQAKTAMAQGGPAAVAEDPVDKLAKLADLRDKGVVTNEEFEAQKKRILGE
jgi:hypothetical protein